tara:strand:+ start:284 stop:490 length:207 start_codon:yes stop_codon:yes gene_type:complete
LIRIELIPYKTHGNHAIACSAFGNLKSSVIFKLIDTIKTAVITILMFISKVFKNLNKPILKIEIAEIV